MISIVSRRKYCHTLGQFLVIAEMAGKSSSADALVRAFLVMPDRDGIDPSNETLLDQSATLSCFIMEFFYNQRSIEDMIRVAGSEPAMIQFLHSKEYIQGPAKCLDSG